ncbi:MAG TPA: SRPBCC domain-containing protein [Candidatus Acidoferrales bacterium]|nr:SRPBCC domain-containing protein [Candidatus Acidoferrales bacterium]
MTTKTTEKTSLEIKRFINAPRHRVYAAWTDPVQLKEWWGPKGVQTLKIIADTRVGGKYRWDLVNQEGERMSVFGEYRELIPGRKVVFTWKWDDDEAWKDYDSIVSVEFFDRDEGTELCLKHEKLPSEPSRDRHNEGWNRVIDRLEAFLNK